MLADNASWIFRTAPYLIFATTWVAAALVPTFATGLAFSPAADLIAIVALLGSARFMLALAGLDVGTSFGGIGSSREMMIASLAEPALLMIAFTLSLLAGSTQLSSVASYMQGPTVGLRVSLAMAFVGLVMVAIAENARCRNGGKPPRVRSTPASPRSSQQRVRIRPMLACLSGGGGIRTLEGRNRP